MADKDEENQEPLLENSKKNPEIRKNPFDSAKENGHRRNEEIVKLNILKPNGTDGENKAHTPMQQINDAYKACGFGWFHIKLIFVSFLGTVSGVLVTHTTSFLLPIAECDLNMGLIEKGLLNAAPFFGMTISSVIGGFLTDTFGRINFLKIGFGGMFLFSILGGTSQTYQVLVTAKFFEGMLFSLSISAHVTYLSEFCYKEIRDRVMITQSSFVALAHIISPGIAWAVLTQDWRYTLFDGRVVLSVWHFYIYIVSLWSLSSFILYCTLPESPKFLISRGRYDEARTIVLQIYKKNTGKSEESFPYKDIWKDIPAPEKTDAEIKSDKGVLRQLVGGLKNAKPLVKPPLIWYLAMLGGTNFVILGVYNVVRLWFPQLSAIVENYGTAENQDLCLLLDTYTHDLKVVNVTANESDICIPKKSGSETYINTIIIGCVSLVPYFITGVLVNKVGKKILIIISALIGCGVTLGMRWSNSKVSLVALFSVATAINQLLKGLNQAVAVEIFPTAIRSLSLSLMMLGGRFGTLSGNIGFPVLLDMGCEVPFYTMSALMFGVAALYVLMPKKKAQSI